MDGGLQCSGAMDRLLSIVKLAENCRERAPSFEVFSAGPDHEAGTRDDVYLD